MAGEPRQLHVTLPSAKELGVMVIMVPEVAAVPVTVITPAAETAAAETIPPVPTVMPDSNVAENEEPGLA